MESFGLEEEVDVLNAEEPHLAAVLLLDTSGSMEGHKINELNESLHVFKNDLMGDSLVRKRVELAVVTFGGVVSKIHDFSSVENFEPPTLTASGNTPMGSAILEAIDLVEKRKQKYKDIGGSFFRPWIFMITDGFPTDMEEGQSKWNEVINKISTGEHDKKFSFFTIGVEEADMEILKKIAPQRKQPLKLKQGRFKEMFLWLSSSMASTSHSIPGTSVKFQAYDEWGEMVL